MPTSTRNSSRNARRISGSTSRTSSSVGVGWNDNSYKQSNSNQKSYKKASTSGNSATVNQGARTPANQVTPPNRRYNHQRSPLRSNGPTHISETPLQPHRETPPNTVRRSPRRNNNGRSSNNSRIPQTPFSDYHYTPLRQNQQVRRRTMNGLQSPRYKLQFWSPNTLASIKSTSGRSPPMSIGSTGYGSRSGAGPSRPRNSPSSSRNSQGSRASGGLSSQGSRYRP